MSASIPGSHRGGSDHAAGSAAELIAQMLVLDPSQRPTLESVATHPWMYDEESLLRAPLQLDLEPPHW